MAFYNITREELQTIYSHLEQAIYNHEQWYETLVRTLICKLQNAGDNLKPNSHTLCEFGKWYHSEAIKNFSHHQGIIHLGHEHMRMHQLATKLLTLINEGRPITISDYDSFFSALQQMRLEIISLKREVEESLFSRDSLTGAINRDDMLPMLRNQQEVIKKTNDESCVIAMIDVDFFKIINDSYGHPAGDKVLVKIAEYFIKHLRIYDKFFRYGGEEFLLCLPDTTLENGKTIAERFCEDISTMVIDITNDKSIYVTLSIGLAKLDSQTSLEQSIENADKALYAAKDAGRNCVKIFEERS